MIVTEKEAIERACVQSPVATVEDSAKAPGRKIFGHANCIGSKCMAWRWAQQEERPRYFRCLDGTAEKEPKPRPEHVPAAAEWSPYSGGSAGAYAGWILRSTAERFGYCGLAGVPTIPRET